MKIGDDSDSLDIYEVIISAFIDLFDDIVSYKFIIRDKGFEGALQTILVCFPEWRIDQIKNITFNDDEYNYLSKIDFQRGNEYLNTVREKPLSRSGN